MRYAVILAGGSGHRLWPASRESLPKQFLALGSDPNESLLQASLRRLPEQTAVVVAAAEQMGVVRRHLPDLPADAFIAEPVARNTAAAIGLAAVHLRHRDRDAVIGILPSDHHVTDEAGFAATVARAFAVAESHDVIATIGIVPTRPSTGFGYLHLGPPHPADDSVATVQSFVEKPDLATAEGYLSSGDYLWNGGMFFLRAERALTEMAAHMPETHAVLMAIADALPQGDNAAAAVAAELYPTLSPVSIDYGIMEQADDVVTLPGDFGWHDVGSWAALADFRARDAAGNVTLGDVVTDDAKNNVIIADSGMVIAAVGVDDLVIVQSGNGILVVPRHRAEEVRAATAALADAGLDIYL